MPRIFHSLEVSANRRPRLGGFACNAFTVRVVNGPVRFPTFRLVPRFVPRHGDLVGNNVAPIVSAARELGTRTTRKIADDSRRQFPPVARADVRVRRPGSSNRRPATVPPMQRVAWIVAIVVAGPLMSPRVSTPSAPPGRKVIRPARWTYRISRLCRPLGTFNGKSARFW